MHRRTLGIAVATALLLSLGAAVPASAQVAAVTAQDRVLGRADAPVTVIEYASFSCNHCAAWHNDVYPAFKTRFVDTGQVRYVFRNLPTQPQQMSLSGAALARCAVPAKFFDVASLLMRNQAAVLGGGQLQDWYAPAIAASGRTQAQIEACVGSPETQAAINADIESAIAAGVNSTPSFFVDGKPVADRSLVGLEAAIRAARAGN
ncbi:MAG: thioredoxin [Alphaproteobacteria bacterium]|nr:MAG: thioredoxin [Alphaproteobacteria bacterium]